MYAVKLRRTFASRRVHGTSSRLPVLIIRVYNSGLEGVLGSGGFDAEEIHGGVSSG